MRFTTNLRRGLIALGTVLALSLTACGSSPSTKKGFSSTANCAIGVSLDTSTKPQIKLPGCATAPTALVTKTIAAGTGPVAAPGDSVTVKYIGFHWTGTKEFDASWDNGLGTFTVSPLGTAGVIEGWNQGLVGARKGARMLLVIPPSLGYGAAGSPPDIAANETLIFVVDVVSVTKAS